MATKTEILAKALVESCAQHKITITTAESCTGGLVAKLITDVAGSSACFETGFVTYSNAAKHRLLAVDEQTLVDFGAVSAEVVREMAAGACEAADAPLSVAISGIAGPGGGSAEKPVGTVWIAWGESGGEPQAACFHFAGDRTAVREAAAETALAGLQMRVDALGG